MSETEQFIQSIWKESITPSLIEYVKIPNQSPAYDPDFATNGYQEVAAKLLMDWLEKHTVEGMTTTLHEEEGKTPLIFAEIEATNGDESGATTMIYSHFDKQPPLDGWGEGLGPYTPVIREEKGARKLYGRGGADDGYGIYASLASVMALKKQGITHGRIVCVVEFSEESGSPDLPFWIEKLKKQLGDIRFVICLDSGCGNYDQLWVTKSLRGLAMCQLKVSILPEGLHSGAGSGIFASSFRIIRKLLSRLEDETTGIICDDFQTEIPEHIQKGAKETAKVLGDTLYTQHNPLEGVQPVTKELDQLILNNTWRPMLSVTGVDGMPSIANAGNVLRPFTKLKLSLRLPPNKNAKEAQEQLSKIFLKDVPYNAKVEVLDCSARQGFAAPKTAPWLEEAFQESSQTYFKKPALDLYEGGTIPFIYMLQNDFPDAQFCVTGVLGPESNAHSVNEFLHLDYAEKLTCCLTKILTASGKNLGNPKK